MPAFNICAFAVCVIVYLCSNCDAADLAVHSIKFYMYIRGNGVVYVANKEIEVKDGDRLEFHEYEPLDGTDPDFIDIGVNVANVAPEEVRNVEIRVSVALKISQIIFIPELPGSGTDPSTAAHEDTYQTAKWFAPSLLLRQTLQQIPGQSTREALFERINLGGIISSYLKRKLWPSELRVEASVEPLGQEDSFENNTRSRDLDIHLPAY
jgi:hypothetical protein